MEGVLGGFAPSVDFVNLERTALTSPMTIELLISEGIGEMAGEICSALAEESRPMTVGQLTEKTGLSEGRLCMAIGWLAREDKLQFSGTKAIIEISLK
jgi:hypothetical protein